MKKIWLITLVLSALTAACGNQNNNATSSPGNPVKNQQQTPINGKNPTGQTAPNQAVLQPTQASLDIVGTLCSPTDECQTTVEMTNIGKQTAKGIQYLCNFDHRYFNRCVIHPFLDQMGSNAEAKVVFSLYRDHLNQPLPPGSGGLVYVKYFVDSKGTTSKWAGMPIVIR